MAYSKGGVSLLSPWVLFQEESGGWKMKKKENPFWRSRMREKCQLVPSAVCTNK
jgi:hypothetical protein